MNVPRPSGHITNIFSLDVEEWYEWWNVQPAATNGGPPRSFESRVRANVELLLEALSEYQAQATFFFLGSVAERDPALVREVQCLGHEIASHGYAHKMVSRQTRDEFTQDVKKSLDILQNITGQPVKGYRAPFWSISQDALWAYEVLVELGLTYNASLFPFKTYQYGSSHAPVAPFVREVKGRFLYEIPATVLKLGFLRFPFGGGFFFRALPYWMTRLATNITNRQGRAVVFYLHPCEIDPSQPRLPLPMPDYAVAYLGLGTTLTKLKRLLSLGPTISISRYLDSLK